MKVKFCPHIGFGQKLVLKIPILQLKLPIRKLRHLFAKKKRHLFDKKNGHLLRLHRYSASENPT